MTRFFYTDPLAAAWMAKHFGMKLLADADDEGGLVDAGARFIDCDDTFRELWQHDFSYLGKLYIHPDSLHLLEPRSGDVVDAVEKNCLPRRRGVHIVSTSAVGIGQTIPVGLLDDIKVIQRNGVSFMWPEREP